MRLTSKFWLMAAAVCGLSMSMSSCKDDKDDIDEGEPASVVTIDQELITHGLETDMKSTVLEVAVKSDGMWTAVLEKGIHWARIQEWQVTYNGAKTLRITVDENNTKVDRKATLKIGDSEGNLTRITLRQTYDRDDNGTVTTSGQAFSDKGLGTGMDYDYALNMKNKTGDDNFQPTKVHLLNNLFNFTTIEQKIADGKMQKSAYVEATIPVAELQATLMDSACVQFKHLNVSLTIGVEVGPVAFAAHGAYTSDKDERKAWVDYTITRKCPMYNVYLSPAELSSWANDAKNNHLDEKALDAQYDAIDALEQAYITQNEKANKRRKRIEVNESGLTDEQEEELDDMYDNVKFSYDYGNVFSSAFTNRLNELYNAITKPNSSGRAIDTNAADATLNALDNEYGPFFIAGGDYGGNLTMYCRIDTMFTLGNSSLIADLSGEVGGWFELEGHMEYTDSGYALVRDINPDIYIVGGNADVTTTSMLATITSGNATDLTKWQDILKDWVASMYSGQDDTPNQSEAAPISYVITPIWTLFNDPVVQEYAQNYFLQKYADRGIFGYFGIMNGTYEATGQDILNKESDFWKKQN